MNWAPIITAIIGLLAPFTAKAGEAAAKKLGEDVYGKLKERFAKDKDESAQKALDNYVSEPDLYKGALDTVLTRKAEVTPDEFGAFLKTLVEKAGVDVGSAGGQTAIGSYIAQADRGSTATVTVGKSEEK
ncbi:MAG: hypothetical protein KKC18_11205 [Chloroflexi bacterium]|nr:hypothetical protein [Chloroflexota bacterium]